jgi:hypothetical protein
MVAATCHGPAGRGDECVGHGHYSVSQPVTGSLALSSSRKGREKTVHQAEASRCTCLSDDNLPMVALLHVLFSIPSMMHASSHGWSFSSSCPGVVEFMHGDTRSPPMGDPEVEDDAQVEGRG